MCDLENLVNEEAMVNGGLMRQIKKYIPYIYEYITRVSMLTRATLHM
jgi:hypothetical protein